MTISNFCRKVKAAAVFGKSCTGCSRIFNKLYLKQSLSVYKTTTGHLFCANCYNSEFDMEAWAQLSLEQSEKHLWSDIENFEYNGFAVVAKYGIAPYKVKFDRWTNDPGIAVCICSDGEERRIPTCVLKNPDAFKDVPKQVYHKQGPTMFGAASQS